MIEKAMSIAMFLFFIMIGINGFLYMASSTFYTESGVPMDMYYGLDTGGFGSDLDDKAKSIEISPDIGLSSSAPSQTQGFVPIQSSDKPVALDWASEFMKLGFGASLVLFRFSQLFPLIAPIINAIATLTFVIQGFGMAYIGGSLGRSLVGRLVG